MNKKMMPLTRVRGAIGLVLAVILVSLAACGDDDSVVPAVPTANLTAQSSSIQTIPALTPAFDPDIHDYVVKCDSTTPVQLKGDLGSGYSEQSFSLIPGRRFRFFVGSNPQEYSVRCLPPTFPPLTVTTQGPGTPQAQWYIFAPNDTPSVTGYGSYSIITDVHGTPVWWYQDSGGASDSKFFGSELVGWSTGNGGFYIRNYAGLPITELSGDLDSHDLQPTPTGTYLAIQYVTRVCPTDCADLSPWGGSAQASVIDAEIHEIDANSNILWKWRTRDHITLAETFDAGWEPTVGDDIIHMNAVQPDGTDHVLFSARHLNAIYRINKTSGAIEWKIGGTPRAESLTVVGDTRPTAVGVNLLSGQHDVRLWADGTVSVHDNGTIANRPPYVMRYSIDTTNATATVVEAISDARVPYSAFTGSARRTQNGNWLVQWGGLPFLTELDSSGNPVVTINYNLGTGFSYRAVPALPGEVAASTLRDGMDLMYAGNGEGP
jgi:Arylsulfotransferase (ASST)